MFYSMYVCVIYIATSGVCILLHIVCTAHECGTCMCVQYISRALSDFDFDGVFFGTKSINRDNFRTNPFLSQKISLFS